MVKIVDSKIKKVVILAIIFMATFVPISNAFTIDDILTQGEGFLEEGEKNNEYKEDEHGNVISSPALDEGRLKESVNQVYNILLTIGIVLSVLLGAILGIKYMVGSIEDQAKIKETLIPYALGCFVVFGAFGIWKIIINLGQSIF